ncbi:hypothetical protein [Maribacter hydrothermalis]|uniref:Uncharacterized protein n=1 Tax=Maribacter hydrothermalis TaxID=1836467 RepID=A0A1B7ZCF9_9FLAO|nr:hypothetical protein [Maribacter hydrothermalis]APQ18631.1 hypothetical protein BTR34_15465 [Maribacter hydrothermalis]OBR40813.1 hypothetical protein A9200_14585 [Maribacter hydrothermalis]
MMKSILIIFLLPLFSFSQNSEIKPYIDFLQKVEKKSAKDYIVEQFKEHDIVILCERDHSEISQYELIKEILSDNYFKENIRNVFTEIGVVNLQPEITKFLKTRNLDSIYLEKKLNEYQQNSEMYPIWERYSYHYFLRTIYDINNSSENQISLYPSDSEFDWKKVKSVEDYAREYEIEIEPRDSLIAQNIINQYKKIKSANNKKALIILNFRHAYKTHLITPNGEIVENAGKYLSDYFGHKAVSILINRPIFFRKDNDWSYKLIQDGKWDATFKYLNTEDNGFDFNNSIFGNDIFDLQPTKNELKYKNVFDGFVFYKPIEKHDLIDYYNGLISKDFEKEFFRRLLIQLEYFENSSMLEKLKDENFRKKLLTELNTKKIRKYRNFEFLIESRDAYKME